MAKVFLTIFLIVPICALCLLFTVEAQRMMMEDREKIRELREARSMGGVSRSELRATTAQAMKTDARMAKLHARYRGKHR